MLNSRAIEPEDETKTIIIYGKNATCNRTNSRTLSFLHSPLITSEAVHIPSNVTIQESGTIEGTAFLQKLELKVEARVMLIHNINTSDGLTNGQQGTVKDVDVRDGRVHRIFIKFDNSNIGQQQRNKFNHLTKVTRNIEWIPIEKSNHQYTLGDVSKNHGARASLIQFPLRLSLAMTSHKCQV